jgi:hypothetical protein
MSGGLWRRRPFEPLTEPHRKVRIQINPNRQARISLICMYVSVSHPDSQIKIGNLIPRHGYPSSHTQHHMMPSSRYSLQKLNQTTNCPYPGSESTENGQRLQRDWPGAGDALKMAGPERRRICQVILAVSRGREGMGRGANSMGEHVFDAARLVVRITFIHRQICALPSRSPPLAFRAGEYPIYSILDIFTPDSQFQK